MRIIDIHTHILPGVDDGAKDWETCMEMLLNSAKSDVLKVIATPHYIPWKTNPTPEEIENLCVQAKKKFFEKHGIAMDIYSGNEIYYSVDAVRDLKAGKILTLAGSRYILVEFSLRSTYQILYRAVKDFVDAGYVPVIAHMERYDCLRTNGRIRELKEVGALFQMNVGAFQGGIFDADSHWSKKCLLDNSVDFLASDMHGLCRRTPITGAKLQWVQKKLSPQYQKELLYANAQKILDGIEV